MLLQDTGGACRATVGLSGLVPLIVAGDPHPISAATGRTPAATWVGGEKEQDAVFGLALPDPEKRGVREEFNEAFSEPCSQSLGR
nr:hypothetical protein [Arthrobacter globiformis]